jgi:hypothetical protein
MVLSCTELPNSSIAPGNTSIHQYPASNMGNREKAAFATGPNDPKRIV